MLETIQNLIIQKTFSIFVAAKEILGLKSIFFIAGLFSFFFL
jgi:hypothetical protein